MSSRIETNSRGSSCDGENRILTFLTLLKRSNDSSGRLNPAGGYAKGSVYARIRERINVQISSAHKAVWV